MHVLIQRRIIHNGTPTISPAGIVDGRGASPGRTSTASTAIRVEVVGTSALLPHRFRQVVSRRRALRVDARGRIDRLVADGAECLSRNMRATVTRFHGRCLALTEPTSGEHRADVPRQR